MVGKIDIFLFYENKNNMNYNSLSVEQLKNHKTVIDDLIEIKHNNIQQYIQNRVQQKLSDFDKNNEYSEFINPINSIDIDYNRISFEGWKGFIFNCFYRNMKPYMEFRYLKSHRVSCQLLTGKQLNVKLPFDQYSYQILVSFANFIELYGIETLREECSLLKYNLYHYPILETREACFTFMLCCKSMNISKDMIKLITNIAWENRYL